MFLPGSAAGQGAAPVGGQSGQADDMPRYAIAADSGDLLEGVAALRVLVALSAPEAEACEVASRDVEAAATAPLRDARIPLVDGTNLTPREAAAVPEVFVALTVVRDETGVCAASLATQLGLDTNVVLLHRNADSPPGTLRLSNAYAELDRAAALLVGVPPTFGEQVLAAVGAQVEEVAGRIRVADQSAP